jgi:transposase
MKVRKAIVKAKKRGLTYKEIAELLDVGEATVSRVLRLHRESKSLRPRPPSGGWFSPVAGAVARCLEAIVRELPDSTLDEITSALVTRTNVSTSRSGVVRALHRLGYSKKSGRSWRRSAIPRSTDGFDKSSAGDSFA